MLAFLLLHANRSVSGDTLTDAVWGAARTGAGNRLQMAVARLRRALEPLNQSGRSRVRTVGGGYMLSVGVGELDAEVFSASVQDGRRALAAGDAAGAVELLDTGLGLWRGPPLVYQRTRTHMAQQLGLEPGPGLQALQADILAQAPSLQTGGAPQLDQLRGPRAPAEVLEPKLPEREHRKIVTVLLVDLVGSTAWAERLDPEALRALMVRSFEMVRMAVEAHGGSVQKFIGDAVVAIFGAPAVHEDDPLRAVRAAVQVRKHLEEVNQELEPELGVAGGEPTRARILSPSLVTASSITSPITRRDLTLVRITARSGTVGRSRPSLANVKRSSATPWAAPSSPPPRVRLPHRTPPTR
jgi:class 3 adenylate cyclase